MEDIQQKTDQEQYLTINEDYIKSWFESANCKFEWHDLKHEKYNGYCPICGGK